MTLPNPASRVFYGWYVAYAIALVMTTTAGLAFYNLPVLLDAFVSQRGFPVALASAATATFFVASGISGVIAGQLVDRLDARYVIVASAGLGALALASIGFLHEPWQLFAFYVAFGAAYGGCGLVPTTTVVARWFETRRAFALSIASTGLSVGGALLAPVSALLILHLGLAGAGPWIALAFLLGVVPATLWIVRSSPATLGLQPYGAERSGAARSAATAPGVSFADAWHSRFFIATAATFLFSLGSQVGGIAHVYRLANTRVDAETATLAVALVAAGSLVGRLIVGWLLVRVSSRAMTFALIVIQTVVLGGLAFAAGRWPVLVGAALFGLTAGSILMMQPLLLAEAFGIREYGRIYSVSQLVSIVGLAIGPAVIGVLYDWSGGYELPYLAAAGTSVIGVVTLALSGPAARSAPAQTPTSFGSKR